MKNCFVWVWKMWLLWVELVVGITDYGTVITVLSQKYNDLFFNFVFQFTSPFSSQGDNSRPFPWTICSSKKRSGRCSLKCICHYYIHIWQHSETFQPAAQLNIVIPESVIEMLASNYSHLFVRTCSRTVPFKLTFVVGNITRTNRGYVSAYSGSTCRVEIISESLEIYRQNWFVNCSIDRAVVSFLSSLCLCLEGNLLRLWSHCWPFFFCHHLSAHLLVVWH